MLTASYHKWLLHPSCAHSILVCKSPYPTRCSRLWIAVVRSNHTLTLNITQFEVNTEMAMYCFLCKCYLCALCLKTPLPDGKVLSKSVQNFAISVDHQCQRNWIRRT